jgi:hypothetical protein
MVAGVGVEPTGCRSTSGLQPDPAPLRDYPAMVGMTGIEPARPEGHEALNLARLPDPPHPQIEQCRRQGSNLPGVAPTWSWAKRVYQLRHSGMVGTEGLEPSRPKALVFETRLST